MKRFLLVLCAAFLLGCSVPTNNQPVSVGPIFDDLLEPTTTTTTTSPDNPTREVTVYFLRSSSGDVTVVSVPRVVAVDAGPTQILNNLFNVRPDGEQREAETDLTTAIPSSAELISAELVDGTGLLEINTRGLFGEDGLTGSELRNALAQIVWTATEIRGIGEVRFQHEGTTRDPIIGNGETTEGAVTRRQYSELA
jgi:spore germination protein GerM